MGSKLKCEQKDCEHEPPEMTPDFDPYSEWLGIPANEQPCDYYRLLGVTQFEDCQESIADAADERMAIVRRYQMGPKAAYTQTLLNELSAARLCLLNAATKATYDAVLRGSHSAKAPAEVPNNPPAVAAVSPTPVNPTPVSEPLGPPAVSPPPPPAPPSAAEALASDELESEQRQWPVVLISVVVVSLIAISGFIGWAAAMRERRTPVAEDPENVAVPEPSVTPPEETQEPEAFEPIVIMQEANGELNLAPATAVLYGDNLQLGTALGKDILTNWNSTDDWVEWRLKVTKPTVFQVKVTYAADKSAVASGKYELHVADATKVASVRQGTDGEFVTDEVFIAIKTSGEHTLQFKAQGSFEHFIDLMSIQLAPATGS
ncbi:MAG TPA: hypothetical protein DCY79_13890 [Planctomycetaceae bacterium]|nr:hypothetical protein [Blastopirellula sp.]HAY80893.1 hypothetical protein [Planctomycetaceae bacterium]